MRSVVQITLLAMVWSTTSPSGVRVMMQDRASRSTRGLREQMPLDSSRGSMGTTWSAKYTDVPRSQASRSRAEPWVT